MMSKSEITTALDAADQFIVIESRGALQKAAEQWRQTARLGIDTEFVRERTYRAGLGLIQLSDGKNVWLADPLKCGSLKPVAALCEDPSTLKVLHAPSEDIAVLWHTTQASPTPLFDTQIACAMLGESLQMSYKKTVKWLLQLDIYKGETRSNWLHRPLRPAQLKYAALDVCLLPLMHKILFARLQAMGRERWLMEDCTRLIDKARTAVDPEMAWQRINGANRLEPTALAILKELAAWREKEADKRNRARGFVVPDAALLTISQCRVTDTASLTALDALHPVALKRYGAIMAGIVSRVLDEGLKLTPPAALNPAQRRLLITMRATVLNKAKALAIDPALLASRRELETLLRNTPDAPIPERFSGWRQAIITDELLALMHS